MKSVGWLMKESITDDGCCLGSVQLGGVDNNQKQYKAPNSSIFKEIH